MPPDPTDPASMAAGGMEVLEQMKMLIEMTTGYRAQCTEAGFSETAAEQMSIDFHHMMIAKIISS